MANAMATHEAHKQLVILLARVREQFGDFRLRLLRQWPGDSTTLEMECSDGPTPTIEFWLELRLGGDRWLLWWLDLELRADSWFVAASVDDQNQETILDVEDLTDRSFSEVQEDVPRLLARMLDDQIPTRVVAGP